MTEVALRALGDDFAEHGAAVIEEVRKTKPHVYLLACTSLCPRQVQTEKVSPFSDISDAEIEQLERYLAASRAKIVRELEQHNGKATEEQVANSSPVRVQKP